MMDWLKNLPFEWAQFEFMRNALVGALLVSPLFGLIGTMIVENKMSFFSDSLGHSALTGIAIGTLIGLDAPIWSMVIFGIVFAALLIAAKRRGSASADTTIGVFSSVSIALGIVILSMRGGFNKYSWYLVGDILAITPGDIAALFALLIVAVIYWAAMYNKLMLVSLNEPFARSRGIKSAAVETSFAILIAFAVMMSIQWIGILVINAMLILPAAAARNISGNVKTYHLFSLIIAICCGTAGLFASYYLDTASGATIVLLMGATYFITLIFKKTGKSG